MSEVITSRGPVPQSDSRRVDGLRVIALFKFAKVLLLSATGYGAHKLLDANIIERLYIWSSTLSARMCAPSRSVMSEEYPVALSESRRKASFLR